MALKAQQGLQGAGIEHHQRAARREDLPDGQRAAAGREGDGARRRRRGANDLSAPQVVHEQSRAIVGTVEADGDPSAVRAEGDRARVAVLLRVWRMNHFEVSRRHVPDVQLVDADGSGDRCAGIGCEDREAGDGGAGHAHPSRLWIEREQPRPNGDHEGGAPGRVGQRRRCDPAGPDRARDRAGGCVGEPDRARAQPLREHVAAWRRVVHHLGRAASLRAGVLQPVADGRGIDRGPQGEHRARGPVGHLGPHCGRGQQHRALAVD